MGFDPSSYTTMPQTGAPGTLALVTAVISASKDVVAHLSAKKALKRLRA